jgi:hypothetical protein
MPSISFESNYENFVSILQQNNQQHGQLLLYPYITSTSISVDFINI